jgi:1,2-diacylglycerol 3-alpha-glucosyltransferase
MRIAHICLSNFYVDGVGYQENELIKQHVKKGHEVIVIASTETHSKEGKLVYVKPTDYIGQEGGRVVRLPYKSFLPEKVMRKLRIYRGLKKTLSQFSPDVILFHGTCAWELRTACQYALFNPHVRFFIDSHEDKYNSARSFLSREILHKRFYGPILRSVIKRTDKVLCYSLESMDFVEKMYKISKEKLELFPLGGVPPDDGEYMYRRESVRKKFGLLEKDILVVQSGKQTRHKKILNSLLAFNDVKLPNIFLYIAGVVDLDIGGQVLYLIEKNDRVKYLGWKNFDELTDLLCAADIYLQPGTQSVTMQHSLCCRCAVILDDVPSHRMYVENNGWLIGQDGTLVEILNKLLYANLEQMKINSYLFAKMNLDYEKLAKRIL